MSFGPVTPAQVDFSDPAVPRSPAYGDIYHARAGADAQARHVFLGGNGLPGRWAGRDRFVVLETGFGLGHNFLATWAAWRDDPRRCARLWFISIERHPLRRDDLVRALAGTSHTALARELVAAWPPLTPDLHPIDFEGGRVRLLLGLGDIAAVMPELVASVDAFYLDGFASDRNPAMWEAHALKRLPRLAAPDATLATWSVTRALRDTLSALDFEVSKAAGFGDKREMTVARFAPRHVPAVPPGRRAGAARRVAVVGAGLAGAGAARALARLGLEVVVVDRRSHPAAETSGNPAGLVHGVVHGIDGRHERWFRACAMHAARVLRPLVDAGRVPGQLDGLLRLETMLSFERMRSRAIGRALPPDYVHALHPDDASAQAGLRLAAPAWRFAGGGWVDPAALVRHWLDESRAALRLGTDVAGIEATTTGWRLLDPLGRPSLEADAVVLANAGDAPRLARARGWPLHEVRGQVTLLHAGSSGLPQPALPLAGRGYAIALPGGGLLCGATSQADDADPTERPEDHVANLAQLEALTGWQAGLAAVAAGRVGWRLLAADRLPLIGPLPLQPLPAGLRADQPRLLPRREGLYALAALGSRGIAQAALAGEVLAAWITGTPMPVPASLLDAVDVARFDARALRQAVRSAAP